VGDWETFDVVDGLQEILHHQAALIADLTEQRDRYKAALERIADEDDKAYVAQEALDANP
jgi:hypothetical protein